MARGSRVEVRRPTIYLVVAAVLALGTALVPAEAPATAAPPPPPAAPAAAAPAEPCTEVRESLAPDDYKQMLVASAGTTTSCRPFRAASMASQFLATTLSPRLP